MPDANSPNTDVNISTTGSSSVAQPQVAVNTPPVENTGSVQPQVTGGPENRVPQSRFNEVISQKNEYASKIEELERRLGAYETSVVQNKGNSVIEDAVGKLIGAGLEPNAARLLVETQMTLTDTRMSERISPMEQRAMKREVEDWISDFAKGHNDYKALEPHMEREFAALPPEQQKMIASSPQGLEMLYWKVKGVSSLEKAQHQVQGAQAQGATEAYQNIALKAAIASTPGSAVQPQVWSRATISQMSPAEYAKRRSEIFAAISSGGIR